MADPTRYEPAGWRPWGAGAAGHILRFLYRFLYRTGRNRVEAANTV